MKMTKIRYAFAAAVTLTALAAMGQAPQPAARH
jgi:hypothetical protein